MLYKYKEKLFPTVWCQLLNVEGMMEFLKNYHLATTTLIIGSGKKHQYILKLVDESLKNSEYFLTHYLLITEGGKDNFIVEKTGRKPP